jgi:hypothetical protein
MSETWADRIIEALRLSSLPLDDDELARRLRASQRQTVNQTCHQLQAAGLIERVVGAEGKIVNRLLETESRDSPRSTAGAAARRPLTNSVIELITEDEVKTAVKAHLEADGWVVTVAWGHERGIDIRAQRADESLIIEAKGQASNPPQQVNYFLGALGELVQRMSDESATYGLALSDNKQYRGLVQRLPELARERLNLTVYFVDAAGAVALA